MQLANKSLFVCIILISTFSARGANWQLYDDFSSGSMDWSKWTQDPDSDEMADIADGQMRLAVTQAQGKESTDTQANLTQFCTAISADMQLLSTSTGTDCGLKMMVGLQYPYEAELSIWRENDVTHIVMGFSNEQTEQDWYSTVDSGVFSNETVYNFTIEVTSNNVIYYVDGIPVGSYASQEGIGTPPYEIEWAGFETRTYTAGDFVDGRVDNVYIKSEPDWELYDNFSSTPISWSKWTQDPDSDELADIADGQMRLAVTQVSGKESTDTEADLMQLCTAVSADMQLLSTSTGTDCGLKMMVGLQYPYEADLSIWREDDLIHIVMGFGNEQTEQDWHSTADSGVFANETVYNLTIDVLSNSVNYYVNHIWAGSYTSQENIGTPPYKTEWAGFETRTYAVGDFVDGRVDNVYIKSGPPPRLDIAVTNSMATITLNNLVARTPNALYECTDLVNGQWRIVETFFPDNSVTNFSVNISEYTNSVFYTVGNP